MSLEAMSIALHHSQSKGTDKLVLIGIANHDGDGGAWPSHAKLAVYANCGVTRVKEAIKKLVEFGEISVAVNQGGDKKTRNDRRPNRYEFLLRCPENCDGTKNHRLTGVTPSDCRENKRGSENHRRGSENDSTGVTPSDWEPSIQEPSIQNHDKFDEFWSVYPRKLGKAKARELFIKAVKGGENPDSIIAGVQWWVRGEWRGKEDRYIPHASTWLGQRRWLDAEDAPTLSVPTKSLKQQAEEEHQRLEELYSTPLSMPDEVRAALRDMKKAFRVP